MFFTLSILILVAAVNAASQSNQTIQLTRAAPTPTSRADRFCIDPRGNTLVENAVCAPDECQPCGYCENLINYVLRCKLNFPLDPTDPFPGIVVASQCDRGDWWNPDLKPASENFGGSCGTWEGLSNAVKDKYINDEKCNGDTIKEESCKWWQNSGEECSNVYNYKKHGSSPAEVLRCDINRFWDPTTETCRACSNVIKLDLTPCSVCKTI